MYRFSRFSYIAGRIARSVAHPSAFLMVLVLVFVWLLSGPALHFNSLWQTVFNSTTTAITFVLLFLIQHTQARETAAIQLKLNELIRASEGSHNALLDIEQLTNRDYDLIRDNYALLAQQAREQLKDGNVKWATARIQMESLESLLDPAHVEPDGALPEARRAQEVVASGLLNAQPNVALDRLAVAASRAIEAPVVLVSLVGSECQCFPGQAGLPEPYATRRETPLSQSICRHVVADGTPLLIADARVDARVKESAAVVELGVIAYAGVPLRTAENVVLGSFCAIDHRPREWTGEEVLVLEAFAAIAMQEITRVSGLTQAAAAPEGDPAGAPRNQPMEDLGAAALLTARPVVLVVDDSATNRKVLSHHLESDGFTVALCESGDEALVLLKTSRPDLILLDIMMQGLDGEQVLQAIQADEALRQIPVVMISALDEKQSVNRCMEEGARDYLLKPFTPQALRLCIGAILPGIYPAESPTPPAPAAAPA